jgi:hypothetical protein
MYASSWVERFVGMRRVVALGLDGLSSLMFTPHPRSSLGVDGIGIVVAVGINMTREKMLTIM